MIFSSLSICACLVGHLLGSLQFFREVPRIPRKSARLPFLFIQHVVMTPAHPLTLTHQHLPTLTLLQQQESCQYRVDELQVANIRLFQSVYIELLTVRFKWVSWVKTFFPPFNSFLLSFPNLKLMNDSSAFVLEHNSLMFDTNSKIFHLQKIKVAFSCRPLFDLTLCLLCLFLSSVVPYWLWFGEEVQRQPHSTTHPLQRRQKLDWHSTLRLHQRTSGHWTEVCAHLNIHNFNAFKVWLFRSCSNTRVG